MSIVKELELLPVLLVEALVEHRFFDAYHIKRKKLELEHFFHMNSLESKYSTEAEDEN